MDRKITKTIPTSSGIYSIESPSGKLYIGQAKNLQRRYRYHVTQTRKTDTKLARSFNKYGEHAHKFVILQICDFTELDTLETFFIKKYNTIQEGLNLIDRNYTYYHTPEAKDKISAGVKSTWTKKRKLNQSETLKARWKEGAYEDRDTSTMGNNLKGKRTMLDSRTGKHVILSEEAYQQDPTRYKGNTANKSQDKLRKPIKDINTGMIYDGVTFCMQALGLSTSKFYALKKAGRFVYL